MAKIPPAQVDVLDLQFKLHCRLKIFQNEDNATFSKPCNIIATASRYGLLFVGTNTLSFQVIQFQNIETYTTRDGDISDYTRRTIPLPSQPLQLSVNCDCTRLSVTLEKDGCVKAIIYDVTSFLKQDILVVQEIRLTSTPGVKVLETSWNPTVAAIFTACKDDGSLGVYELKGTGIEINELPTAACATCMCWSPKGKQIAVGSRDGKITQYKPDLKVARVVNAPPLEGTQHVVALQWISNYQFIAVYRPSGPEAQSSLLVVDAPKAGEVIYTNYEDICYSYGTARPHQFYMLLQPTWNILMVASSNSMEVGVVGLDKDQWTQWILTDSARAELPLSATKQDTLPVGLALDTSSTQSLPWGDNVLPPTPLLLLLSHHGTLCCFNVVNLKPGVATICQAPEQLPDKSGLAKFTKASVDSTITALPNKPVAINPIKQSIQVPTYTPQQPISTGPANVPLQAASTASGFSFSSTSNFQLPKSTAPGVINSAPNLTQTYSMFGNVAANISSKPAIPAVQSQPLFSAQPLFDSKKTHHVPVTETQSFASKITSDETIPKSQPVTVGKASSFADLKSLASTPSGEVITLNEETETLIAQLVKEECTMLESELMALLHKGFQLKVNLGNDTEATSMVMSTNALQKFVDDATETSASLAAEIHCLKQSLIQTWVWYEDARSRFMNFKDPKLLTLMRIQPLDPASTRQLTDIHHIVYYLESQLYQGHAALDDQWQTFQDSCKKTLSYRLPSIEAIYQSMVKQSATLQKQTYILKDISNRIRMKKRNIQPPLLVSLDNADKLEEQLKSLQLEPKNLYQVQYERVLKKDKLLTKTKSDNLIKLLMKRKVSHVSVSKPQLSNSTVQQSSLISAPFSPINRSRIIKPTKLNFVQSTPKPVGLPAKSETFISANAPSQNQTKGPEIGRMGPFATASSPQLSKGLFAESSKEQHNVTFSFSKPATSTVSAPNYGFNPKPAQSGTTVPSSKPLSFMAVNSKAFGGSAFVPTTQSGTLFKASTPSTLASVTITPISKTASTSAALENPQQKLMFSLNTPVSVIPITTTTKTAITSSISVFSSPVASVTADSLSKPSVFGTKPPTAAVSTSTFSFQTLTTGSASTPSFSSFGFASTQSPAVKSPSAPTMTKPSTTQTAVFGIPVVTTTVQASVFAGPAISVALIQKPTTSVAAVHIPAKSSADVSTTTQRLSSSATTVPVTSVSPFSIIPIAVTTKSPASTTSATITTLAPVEVTRVPTSPLVSSPPLLASSSVTTSATQISLISSTVSPPSTTAVHEISKETSVFSTASSVTQPSLFATTQPTFGLPPNSSATQFGFGGKPASTETSIFAMKTATTTASVFSKPAAPLHGTPSTSASIFGTAPTTTISIFGTAPTTTASIFGNPPARAANAAATSTTSAPIFGKPPATVVNASATSTTSASIFGTPFTTASSIFGASTTKGSIFGSPSTSPNSVFGTPSTTSSFMFVSPHTTSASLFGSPPANTTSIFGTSTTTTSSVFGTPATTSVFGTPTTTSSAIFGGQASTFGTSATTTSVFAPSQTTASSIFGAAPSQPSVFGTVPTVPPLTGGIFGATPAKPGFGAAGGSDFSTPKTTASSVFGSGSVFGTPTTSSVFGNTASSSIFGQPSSFGAAPAFNVAASTSSGNVFGSIPSSTSNAFGNPPTSSIFGTPTSSTQFGSSSLFGAPTKGSSFGAATNSFGSSQANSFSFTAAANAANVPSTGTGFGFNKPAFGFGNPPSSTDANSFSFGGLNVGSPTTTSSSFGSGFGQSQSQNQNPFGRTSDQEQKTPFGGGSLFGSPAATSSSSIFGGASPFGKPATAFGGAPAFGTPAFGQQNTFGQNSFGSGGSVFGSSSQPGPFSGGNQSVSQTGFGGAPAFQKPSGFGGQPVFGSTSPGGFGSPPAFGSTPSFGTGPAFGSPSKVFGAPAPESFGSPGQQNSTFANLANQSTLGFGSLAQQGASTGQPTAFSGSSSFSSWR